MIEKQRLLKKVLSDNILITQNTKKRINLKETDNSATLKNAVLEAENYEYILLSPDKVRGLDSLFKSEKGQLKNCDYILLVENKNIFYSIFIELKSGIPRETKYIQQFKGSSCLLEYIDIVLKNFYEQTNFFKIFKRRYIVLHQAPIDKQPTRIQPAKNNTPEKARLLKVASNHTFKIKEFL